jgi:hypothetical protein
MPAAPEIVITATMLRLAIRAKLGAGSIKRRHVSVLIDAYVAADPPGEVRTEEGISRRPVEHIPHSRRAAFLEALEKLSLDLSVNPTEGRRLAG